MKYQISDAMLTPEGLDKLEELLKPRETRQTRPLAACIECLYKVQPSWQYCPRCGTMQWEWVNEKYDNNKTSETT